MGRIVVGIASSHTPQLSSGVDMWPDHAERDRRNPRLLGRDARFHSYGELLATADPALRAELGPAVWAAKYRRCQEAVAALTRHLARARAEVAIVVGDDQREMFADEGIPTFACCTGTVLTDVPASGEALERMPAGIRAAAWAAHGDRPQQHKVCADLSRHVTEAMVAADFDVTCFSRQAAGRSLGHAFTFPRYRLGLGSDVPIVPVFVNTYYPPNVPSARRCHALGRVLRAAVESWPGDTRVAVIASGGLSHFVVDEDLDRKVLSGIEKHDADALGGLSRDQLRSGTSEILNWITVAGALENLPATVLDYVPGYRTPAGTGAGMAFVYWQ